MKQMRLLPTISRGRMVQGFDHFFPTSGPRFTARRPLMLQIVILGAKHHEKDVKQIFLKMPVAKWLNNQAQILA